MAVRDNIDKLNKIITEKIIHVRSSAMMPDTKGMKESTKLLAETHAVDDLLQMGFDEFKDKITVFTEQYNGFAPPSYTNESKHVSFHVIDETAWAEFMKHIKEIVKEVLQHE